VHKLFSYRYASLLPTNLFVTLYQYIILFPLQVHQLKFYIFLTIKMGVSYELIFIFGFQILNSKVKDYALDPNINILVLPYSIYLNEPKS
jgi:hypothetical protein